MNQVEPSAGMRQAAHQVREMYISLVNEGFTEEQAMNLVRSIMLASLTNNTDDDDKNKQ